MLYLILKEPAKQKQDISIITRQTYIPSGYFL